MTLRCIQSRIRALNNRRLPFRPGPAALPTRKLASGIWCGPRCASCVLRTHPHKRLATPRLRRRPCQQPVLAIQSVHLPDYPRLGPEARLPNGPTRRVQVIGAFINRRHFPRPSRSVTGQNVQADDDDGVGRPTEQDRHAGVHDALANQSPGSESRVPGDEPRSRSRYDPRTGPGNSTVAITMNSEMAKPVHRIKLFRNRFGGAAIPRAAPLRRRLQMINRAATRKPPDSSRLVVASRKGPCWTAADKRAGCSHQAAPRASTAT